MLGDSVSRSSAWALIVFLTGLYHLNLVIKERREDPLGARGKHVRGVRGD